jgi:hypothetical protein
VSYELKIERQDSEQDGLFEISKNKTEIRQTVYRIVEPFSSNSINLEQCYEVQELTYFRLQVRLVAKR